MISVEYGSASWSGIIVQETVGLAGVGPFEMEIGSIRAHRNLFRKDCRGRFHGLMGLGAKINKDADVDSIIEVMSRNGVGNGFAIQLCGTNGSGEIKTGNFWIGGYDSFHTESEMVFVPYHEGDFYRISLHSFVINGQTIPVSWDRTPHLATVDSGTTFIIFNNASLSESFTKIVKESGLIVFENTKELTSSLMDSFWAGKDCIPLSLSNYSFLEANISMVAGNGIPIPLSSYNLFQEVSCQDSLTGALSPCICYAVTSQPNEATSIIGETVMINNMVFFDRSLRRIGFAKGKNCGRNQ